MGMLILFPKHLHRRSLDYIMQALRLLIMLRGSMMAVTAGIGLVGISIFRQGLAPMLIPCASMGFCLDRPMRL